MQREWLSMRREREVNKKTEKVDANKEQETDKWKQ